LKDIGLPQNHLPVALLTFNVGVELGQLLLVGLAYTAYRGLKNSARFALARTPALYVIGSVAAYWSIGRISASLPDPRSTPPSGTTPAFPRNSGTLLHVTTLRRKARRLQSAR